VCSFNDITLPKLEAWKVTNKFIMEKKEEEKTHSTKQKWNN